MAAEQSAHLAQERDRLASDTAAALSGFQTAHRSMAAEQRAHLAQERDRLASDTAAMLSDLQVDRGDAQRVWRGFNALIEQRRAWEPAAPPPSPTPIKEAPPEVIAEKVRAWEPGAPPPPPTPIKEAPPEVIAEEVRADDLTAIPGIGPGMQGRLNQAGIHTYAQLAGSTLEALRQAIGGDVASRRANVEEWIEHARELAGQT